MEGEVPNGAVSTLQHPANRAFWQREEGRNRVDGQGLFGPAASGQQGEQQAHCAPKSALPLPTRGVLLGLPRTCLKPLAQQSSLKVQGA